MCGQQATLLDMMLNTSFQALGAADIASWATPTKAVWILRLPALREAMHSTERHVIYVLHSRMIQLILQNSGVP